jgi:uncharacterized membrane protein
VEPQQPYAAAPAPGELNVGDAISYGWAAFKATPGPLVLITLVFLVVSGVINGLGGAFQDQTVIYLFFQLLSIFVGILLYMGMIRVALKVTSGVVPEIGDLFKPEHFGSYLGAGLLVGIIVTVGLVFCIIPGIYLGIALGFFGFLILGRGEKAIDSISGSWALTEGNRGTLFLLGLAVFGINLVGALLCGVGLLVTYPLTIIAMGYAYRVLSGETPAPIVQAG